MQPDERRALSSLLARLADGDRSAFHPAFACLWPLVRGFAGRVLSSDADADDAAQRAMLSVLERANEYDSQRDGLAWALGITWWQCRTLLRSAERRREVVLDRHDPPTTAPSPEQTLLDAERLCAVTELLGELSVEDRQALGIESPELAVAPATLRKRRQRAFARLRSSWNRNHGPR